MERVQINLERLLPELRDLEKKKIFDKTEISEIVKRRTTLETALIRKGSNEQDWLSYIEYEKRLEQLRKLRTTKMKLKGRPTVSDYSITRHILSLYSSAVTRMPGSTKLWQAYVSHILKTSNSSPEISRVLARAISLHPTNSAVWLLAIRFEADGTGPQAKDGGIGGGNIDAARKLAMRALRFMKGAKVEDAQKIWLEWTRLEISFVERMRKRWEVLGISSVMAGKANLEMEVDVPVPVEGAEEVEAAEQDVEAAQKQGQSTVLDGAIVKVVLENACAAYPNDLSMHRALLSLIRPMPTVLRPELLLHIYDILREQLPNFTESLQRAQACSILGRRYLDDLVEASIDGLSQKALPVDSLEWIDAVSEAVKAYKASLAEEDMLELQEDFAEFLSECWGKTEDTGMKQYLQLHLLKVFRASQKQGRYSDRINECVKACQEVEV